MSYWPTAKTWTSFSVQSLFITWTLSCNMSLLTTIETVCKLISLFCTVSMIMIRRSTFVTESSTLVSWAVSKKMLSRTTLETFFLIPFFFFHLQDDFFLFLNFLLNSFFFIFLFFLQFFIRINDIILRFFKCLFELSQFMIKSFSFGFILLNFFSKNKLWDLLYFLLDFLDVEMNFLFHHFLICYNLSL